VLNPKKHPEFGMAERIKSFKKNWEGSDNESYMSALFKRKQCATKRFI
jgi:hypothetical protein